MQDKSHCALKYLQVKKDANGTLDFSLQKNPTMADLFSEEGVNYFIKLTHERYYKRFGELFGSTIEGKLTDEPCFSYYGNDAYKNHLKIQYIDGLQEQYKEIAKSDLRSDIAKDIGSKNPNWKEPVLKIIERRFSENYCGKLADWCAAHNVKLTGHLMSEQPASRALWASGHPLTALSKFQLPGMDEIPTATSMYRRPNASRNMNDIAVEWLTLHTVMYAIDKHGNRGGLAEMFALGPCDMPMGIMRREVWQEAAFGVDTYVLAISQLDFRVRLSDDPYLTYYMSGYMNSFTPSQTWFYDLKNLAADAKKAAYFAKKERVSEIVVRYKYDDTAKPQDLLEKIARSQMSSRLIHDGEACDAKIIATISGDGVVYDEVSKTRFANADEFVEWAALKSKRGVVVKNSDATLATDFFVREFSDGSYIVLNYGGEREAIIETPSGTRKIFARNNDVFFYDAKNFAIDEQRNFDDLKTLELASLPILKSVKCSGANTLRPQFKTSKIFEFELKDNLPLVFSIRNYGGAVQLILDGNPIEADGDSAILEGFKGLYKTVKRKLAKGLHRLELKNDAPEFPYLPIAIISGNFAYDGKNSIKKYCDDGKGLDGVFGEVTESLRVEIPRNAQFIDIGANGAVVELFINGKSLGTKCWHPYVWSLPKDLCGTNVDLKIKRKISIGRIFGDEMFLPPISAKNSQPFVFRPFSVGVPFAPRCDIKFLGN